MRQSSNAKFERMRLEAERKRLHELETQAAELSSALQQQNETDRQARDALQAENAALKDRLEVQSRAEDTKTANLEAKIQALTEALDERIEAMAGQVANVDSSLTEPEKLRTAIAPVLVEAMRDAGAGGRDSMASAIAPYVVGTIKTEILNSQDELVEVIQPRIGTMIKASLERAIEDLNRKVDDALPFDRWMAAMKGKVTGAPSAGWILEDGERFAIKDALLIERHSGVLLASEHRSLEEGDQTPDEDLMAGMIAALQGFASDAYGSTGAGDLRRFSFTEDTVYLRGTPTKILALRCSGVAPPEIESRVDEVLTSALERVRDVDGSEVQQPILMLDHLTALEEAEPEGLSPSTLVGRGLVAVAAVVALVWGHIAVDRAHEDRRFEAIEQAIAADQSLGPYPVEATRQDGDAPVLISGLLPDDAARIALQDRIDWLASPLPIEYDLALVGELAR